MRKLVLFDIDGTLVLTAGAGYRALSRAVALIVGGTDPLSGIPVAGRTDRIIVQDVVARLGVQLDDDMLARLRDQYLVNLREEIERPGPEGAEGSAGLQASPPRADPKAGPAGLPTAEFGPRAGIKAVMPGVRELLGALDRRDDVFVGLLTGNFEPGARIKLEYFDLWRYFRCGAYGDDAADRNALVPFALERARACGLPDLASEHILVVGDTPHDVACAHAAGAVAVGVATGGFTVDQLHACGADVVFEDLSDTEAFLRLL